ncbi:MAG: hydrogenase, partial [Phycisphaerales bacterium]|nr:hydrogenase [Phycisphaerales bacterium]
MTTLPLKDNTGENPSQRAQLILNHTSFGSVTDDILKGNECPKPPRSWYIALAISFSMMSMLGVMIGYLIFTGVGVWGNNNPVMWGFPIVNF